MENRYSVTSSLVEYVYGESFIDIIVPLNSESAFFEIFKIFSSKKIFVISSVICSPTPNSGVSFIRRGIFTEFIFSYTFNLLSKIYI